MDRLFREAMRMMRRRNPQTAEDGFGMLQPVAHRYVAELMVEFAAEADHGLRCWLLELIGDARSPEALPLLAAQSRGADEALRRWAVRGLEQLDTKDARRLLWEIRRSGGS
jgi:HEAT repeat protein